MIERTVKVIWPETKLVSASRIRVWFLDAIANGRLDGDEDELKKITDINEQARRLDDAGIITLGKN